MLLCCLAVPSVASALSVSVESIEQRNNCDRVDCFTGMGVKMSIVDEAGVDDDVSVRVVRDAAANPTAIEVVDALAPVSAGKGCSLQTVGVVVCALPANRFNTPRVKVDDARTTLDLGAGNDVMRIGPSWFIWEVRGGPGNDTILGDPGARPDWSVTWVGGSGADLAEAPVAVSYSERTAPVTVTVGDGLANDGEPGEGDNIGAGVFEVVGGSGDDRITGNDADPLQLVGGPGDDMLRNAPRASGGIGNDSLTAGAHSGNLEGGPGNDRLVGGPGGGILDAGTGTDVLVGGSGRDVMGWNGTARATGGDGDDVFFMRSTKDRQVIDGGAGRDWFSGPGNRSAPNLRITLDGRANDGKRGQHSNVLNVEKVDLMRGTIVGSSADEELTVWYGSVYGRGGDDIVTGSRIVDGGSGNDVIQLPFRYRVSGRQAQLRAKDGERDRIRCAVPGYIAGVKSLKRDKQDRVVRCRIAKSR